MGVMTVSLRGVAIVVSPTNLKESLMSVKQVSRRQFVKRTLAASAVAATPNILKAAVSNPPSEKLNVAVIGLGAIGGWHATQMSRAEEAGKVNFVGMCDADWGYATVKKNFDKHPKVKRYWDYRKML